MRTVGVIRPNLELHLRALEQRAAENPNKQIILQEIKNICAYEPETDALSNIRNCKCFPVKSSGSITWESCSAVFAIADRKDYLEAFSGRLAMLDLTLEETHSIRWFLDALDLADRYLSQATKEETSVEGGALDNRLTSQLRRKSYAMCRLVFESPVQSLKLTKVQIRGSHGEQARYQRPSGCTNTSTQHGSLCQRQHI